MGKKICKNKNAVFLIITCILLSCFIAVGFVVRLKVAEGSKPRKFGATYMTMNNPYFVAMNNTIEKAVQSNGDILISRDPAQNQDKQNGQIQEMIGEGVSAIFLNPVDWKGAKPALIACRNANIPVFNIDTYVYDSSYVASSVVSDNYQAGVQCAEDMMRRMSRANIVILNCQKMQSICDRVKGFKDTISSDSRYKVVKEISGGGELEISMAAMNEIIHSGIQFNVVMGGNDPTALGSLAALQKNHCDSVAIYGVDGSPDGKNMIREGLMTGTSAQSPMKIGDTVVRIAYDYLDGKRASRTIIIPVTLVTKANIEEFDINGWQ